ncbi:MAG: glutathione S-transferase N-terminal domain-containing protein [Microcoleaceae cyanobacterium MO_207.B10]|nr:glutathione S-transferase N-terminal domain-containing protein [Microcoleaceae cyanobacterium MO_207.B10]
MTEKTSPQWTLFYTPGACSLAGIIALEWSGKPYHLVRITKEERASEAFAKVNPLKKVPALSINDRLLSECSAILQHISNHSPQQKMLPEIGTVLEDTMNQWFSYLGSGFHVSFFPLFVPFRFTTIPDQQEGVKQAALQQIRHQYEYLDSHLSNSKYILGETKYVIDPYLLAMARWGENFFDIPQEFPHVFRHISEMREDPRVKISLAIENGEIVDNGAAHGSSFLGHVSL